MHPRRSYEFFCCATSRRAFCKTLLALRTVDVIWSLESVKLRSYAIHCLSISKSYAFVTTDASTPLAVQLFSTDALQRALAVLYNCSPRWLLILLVLDVVFKKELRSKPVLLIEKSNNPDKSKLIPESVDVALPDFTLIIAFLILSKSFFNWVLSLVFCISSSAAVCVNRVSTSSADRPMY